MNYTITGLSDQAQVLDKLKSAGAEVIQSSNGLVCKTTLSHAEIERLVGDGAARIEAVRDVESLSPDVRAFLGE